MKTHSPSLFAIAATCLSAGILSAAPARAAAPADQICTFQSKDAHYYNLTSPSDYLCIQWHSATGQVRDFEWIENFNSTAPSSPNPSQTWFPYVSNYASQQSLEAPTTSLGYTYAGVQLFSNVRGHELDGYPLSIKGQVAPGPNVNANATFTGVVQGVNGSWFVAYGSKTCVDATQTVPSCGGHSMCSTGDTHVMLDPCAAKICTIDSYCCKTAWDASCVGEVASICGQKC